MKKLSNYKKTQQDQTDDSEVRGKVMKFSNTQKTKLESY